VLDGDREVVESVEELEARVDADAEALGILQDRQAEERAAAEGKRNEVAVLVEQQRLLAAEAEAEVERHRQILAQLESDEQAHRALIANLDADSARLTEELRAAEAAAARSGSRAAPPSGSGRFQRPSDGRVTSGFGYRVHPIFGTGRLHAGTDFGAPSGSPIYAAEAGVVVSAGVRGGYGNATVIDHGGGVATLYAHQSRLGVRAGERVARGQVIGYVGSTGYSTGPHLHFEVRVNGTPVDPMGYL
jgi:murein DD-endopeptidase MepM/ murein hydrolase activator NlpD